MDSRLHNAVGLAMKAGKCISGDFAVEQALRASKVKLVLLDEDASENTRDRYERLCRRMNADLKTMTTLGDAIGKPSRMIAAVTDENMTKLILSAFAQQDRNGGRSDG